MKIHMFAVCAAVAVSGCMGGGGSAEKPTKPPLDVNAYVDQIGGFYKRLENKEAKPMTEATKPSGTISMRGLVGAVGDKDDKQLIGTMDVDANFDASTISGNVTDMGLYPRSDPNKKETLVRSADVDGTLNVAGTIYKGPRNMMSKVTISGDFTSAGNSAKGIQPFTGKVNMPDMVGNFARDADGTVYNVAKGKGTRTLKLGSDAPFSGEIFGTYVISEEK